MSLARCEHVTHAYLDAGTRVTALDDVSIDVRAAELLVVVGPSGSGKSTLLAALAGLLRPSGGEVWLAGEPLAGLDAEGLARVRRKHLGFVFQSFHLFGALSARGNVECVLEMKGESRRDQRDLATRALERVGLGARLDHLPAQLSGGERQRVAVARALATDPVLIIGDEPTSSLDGASARLVLDALQSFVAGSQANGEGTGRAVVLATHDPRLLEIATRVVTLEDGRLVDAVPR